jgi:hypothetical protein
MKFQRRKSRPGIGGFALLAAGSVVAQDIRVNVTGSNIKRVDTETAAPIEIISREDIQASASTIWHVQSITANNNATPPSSMGLLPAHRDVSPKPGAEQHVGTEWPPFANYG